MTSAPKSGRLFQIIRRRTTATRPDLDIDLVDTDSTDVRHLVETGQVDLGIAGLAADLPSLAKAPIFRDPFKLVCRSDSHIAAKGPLRDWSDLEGESLIVNEASRNLQSPAFQRLAREARFSVRNVASLIAMVQAGMGVTLLPALATVNLPATLTAYSLRDPACLRTVSLYWREGKIPSPVTQVFLREFVSAAQSQAQALGLEGLH